MYDLLLTNAVVITVDSAHTLYDRGFVAVKGDRIAALGPMDQLPDPLPEAERVLNLSGASRPGGRPWPCWSLSDQNPRGAS